MYPPESSREVFRGRSWYGRTTDSRNLDRKDMRHSRVLGGGVFLKCVRDTNFL